MRGTYVDDGPCGPQARRECVGPKNPACSRSHEKLTREATSEKREKTPTHQMKNRCKMKKE